MSRYLSLIVLTFCISFISNASEKQFWVIKGDLQQKMLASEYEAETLMNKLEEVFNKSKVTSTMTSALFEAKLDHLEFYGNRNDLKSHIETGILKISQSHTYYNVYLSKLAILHFEFGELEKYTEIIEKINQLNGQIFSAVSELTTTPSNNNFQLVNSYCNENCNFYLYHKAIANFYAVTGQYHSLKTYVIDLLNTEYKVNGFYGAIKRTNILAYLYVVSKCYEPNKEYVKEIRADVLTNMEYLKGSYARINETLDISCM
ncbi:MAG: hypothetical protein HRT54_18210 [Colwellia sp.]|nr:hypothetical protein [Colwellia sp.]